MIVGLVELRQVRAQAATFGQWLGCAAARQAKVRG